MTSPVYHCANLDFRRQRQHGPTTFTKQPFGELLVQCLELVGESESPDESQQMQLHRYWTSFSASIIPGFWKLGRFEAGRKRCPSFGRSNRKIPLTLRQMPLMIRLPLV